MNIAQTKAKNDLIQNIIFRVSLNAAFQRNKIYHKKLSATDDKKLKLYLKTKLASLLNQIQTQKHYTDIDHYKTIILFSEEVSGSNNKYLENGRLTIGTSQKLINVYWKMSWLLQKNIPVPIHCPFDGFIIRNLGKMVRDIKWTNMDKIDDYKRLVTAAKQKSNGISLAKWELLHYNNIGLGL